MSIINNGLLLASGADAAVGYQISRSLRFNSADSAYLSRTPGSAGNRKTWTWSGWVKRSGLGARQVIFGTGDASFNNTNWFEFFNTDTLRIGNYTTSFQYELITTQVFRDVSAWGHLVIAVDTTQSTASNRIKVYWNGVQITQFSTASYPSQNLDTLLNTATEHGIGRAGSYNNYYLSGYLADIHFIDGQALTPSDFAETNATTGQWVPKAYAGSYGTNGFRLTFSDNSGTTSTTLGKDAAGSNNWTPNNFSVASGSGNDSLVDSPTSYGTDTGAGGEVRGNYCTLNPLNTGATSLANGNLEVTTPSTGYGLTYSTIAVSTGKWYWEVFASAMAGNAEIGISKAGATLTNAVGMYAGGYSYVSGQFKGNNNSYTSYGASYTTNDIIGVALDLNAGTLVFYKNGVSQGTAFSSLTGEFFPVVSDSSNSNGSTLVANFGQRAFAYTAPSGFKALVDTNLTAPTIAKPASYFDTVLYTGTGSSLTPTSTLGFGPEFIWIKGRSGATDHALYDAVRGVEKRLESNNTDAEVTSDGGVTAFNSAGFTVGTLAQVNTSSATYVAWAWDAASSNSTNTSGTITSTVRANATAGFSIVTYTGTGSNATVGHGLGVAPQFIIVKRRNTTGDWATWHTSIANTNYLLLNSTAASTSGTTYWNSTSPTSSLFSVGTATNTNANTGTYVAYCFAPVAGYSAFGSYTGNGSTDGPFVFTGFRPRWVLLKDSTNAGSWELLDAARIGYNGANYRLFPNLSDAEFADNRIDILSNGFKVRAGAGTAINTSNAVIVYACFAENPFAYARAR